MPRPITFHQNSNTSVNLIQDIPTIENSLIKLGVQLSMHACVAYDFQCRGADFLCGLDVCLCMYLIRKCAYRDIQHII